MRLQREKQWLKTPQGRALLHEYASSCLGASSFTMTLGCSSKAILAEEETRPEEAEALPAGAKMATLRRCPQAGPETLPRVVCVE
ncbi:hypothetical protein J2S74_002491 [Evansella vedderi]|uniref:Uncharacterized protein n=1 Tax=Evansella vedderi TaxID=38282 RepID=A0ABT9ZV66_9BACI|nr:hypothetical protein [Evansella vedderi]